MILRHKPQSDGYKFQYYKHTEHLSIIFFISICEMKNIVDVCVLFLIILINFTEIVDLKETFKSIYDRCFLS